MNQNYSDAQGSLAGSSSSEKRLREGVGLKELTQSGMMLYRYLVSKWLIFVLVGLVAGGAGIVYSIYSKPKYTGKLTFVLAGDSKGSGLAGLAGQMGLNLGDNSDAAFSGDNIIELFQSRRIIERALLRKIPEVNKSILNHYVTEMELDAKWRSKERLKGAYPFPDSALKFTPVQDSLVREVVHNFKKEHISITRIDKKLIVYDVETVAKNELIANYTTRFLTEETARLFIELKTKAARENLVLIRKEADSLGALLGGTIRYIASEADRTLDLNPALQVQRSGGQFGQSRIGVLGVAYGEVVKHLEVAKINLQKETPLFQIIDNPTLPLKAEKPGKAKSALLFAFVAGLFTMLFFILKRNSQ